VTSAREFAKTLLGATYGTELDRASKLIEQHDAEFLATHRAEAAAMLEKIFDFLDEQTPEDADKHHWAARAYQEIATKFNTTDYAAALRDHDKGIRDLAYQEGRLFGLTEGMHKCQETMEERLNEARLDEAIRAHGNVKHAANVTGCQWCNRVAELRAGSRG
jgi:hypothetical protein